MKKVAALIFFQQTGYIFGKSGLREVSSQQSAVSSQQSAVNNLENNITI
jgi:cell division protein FtsB